MSMKPKPTQSENTDQADGYQVDSNNEADEFWLDQDANTGKQREYRHE